MVDIFFSGESAKKAENSHLFFLSSFSAQFFKCQDCACSFLKSDYQAEFSACTEILTEWKTAFRDHFHYREGYRGAAHSICSLKYNILKNVPVTFLNGSNYDYHFITKELAEEFKKQFTFLGENTEKCITFTVLIEKEITGIDKSGEEMTKKIYLAYCSLLIAQDLWQAHYQILSIIFLMEFIKLNVNTDSMIKNLKLAELNTNIAIFFLNT